MDRLQTMTAFLAVADLGGFAAAARKLNVSPSVVTRAVGELEERLGVRLFTRTTRTVRLTEAGARFGDHCRQILTDIEEAEASAAGVHAAPRGALTITAPAMFGRMYVMPVVTAYLARFPDVDVHCWYVDRVVNLVEEGVDVAVRIGELSDSGLQATRVGRVRRVVCAAPSYLESHGIPQRPEELARHRIISASGVTPTTEWRFKDGERTVVARLHPRLTTTTNDSAIVAAQAGFGLTRLLSYQIAGHLAEGSLRIVLEEFEFAALPVHIVHREGRHAAQKVRAFIDTASEMLRADESLH